MLLAAGQLPFKPRLLGLQFRVFAPVVVGLLELRLEVLVQLLTPLVGDLCVLASERAKELEHVRFFRKLASAFPVFGLLVRFELLVVSICSFVRRAHYKRLARRTKRRCTS